VDLAGMRPGDGAAADGGAEAGSDNCHGLRSNPPCGGFPHTGASPMRGLKKDTGRMQAYPCLTIIIEHKF
jgi:hypothetical protein